MSDGSTPADQVRRALARLRAAEAGLRSTRWRERVRVLGQVGARFLDPDDPLHQRATERVPDDARLSAAQARWVIEGMARDWTEQRLEVVVRTEFEDPDVLDRWVDDPRAPEGRCIRAFPLAPGPAVHVAAGSVPGVSVTSLLRGLLVGGPVLLKPGSGDGVLPALFLEGLQEEAAVQTAARALAEAVAVVRWKGGSGDPAESLALDGAGSVVVHGGVATVAALRARVPVSTPLVEYGHRVGLVVVGERPGPDLPRDVAGAVAAFDQRGCVCPQRLYLVGTTTDARALAGGVAEALQTLATEVPPGDPTTDVASAVHQLRGTARLREAAGEGVEVHEGAATGWTVVLDPDPVFVPSPLGRTLVITPIPELGVLDEVLPPIGPFLQTVGVDGFAPDHLDGVAERLCRMGASRVVPVARMAFPPAWWLHDGQGPLRRLVRWAARGPY